MRKSYGVEFIIDLHDCDVSTFNRASLDCYFSLICKAINMKKCERYFWDDVGVSEADKQTSPKTKGSSAVQFILTSSIVIHTLDLLGSVYVNIFACKEFDQVKALEITKSWFGAKNSCTHSIIRT